jgi:hypothetical protein
MTNIVKRMTGGRTVIGVRTVELVAFVSFLLGLILGALLVDAGSL